MFRFNLRYFLLTILLFVVEVLIALFLNDPIIRPYGGDVIVVMLVYCFVKSFVDFPVLPTTVGVLLFAFGIEVLQYLRFVELVGLQDNKLATTLIGHSFSWVDMLCYVIGAGLIILFEWREIRLSESEN